MQAGDADAAGDCTRNGAGICEAGMRVYQQAWADGGAPTAATPKCLTRLGLVHALADDPNTVVPMPPDIAAADLSRPLEEAISEQQEQLSKLRRAVAEAEPVYREFLDRSRPAIRQLSGAATISTALAEAVDSCRFELLTAQPGGGRPAEILEQALTRDLALSARGVRQRTLYQHTVRNHPPTRAYIQRVSEHGAQVRTINQVFDRLIICDRAIAFVPAGPDRQHSALVINTPSLVDYLVKVFEYMWDHAVTLSVEPGGGRPELLTDRVRRDVIRLVVDGCTDAGIAHKLGISTRTVSKHIQRVSEELGSRSRAQLGYLVHAEGWFRDE
ncbi:helix-turn-helix transcriptional regulator [Streptacidiphilus jiangxiensis]|uniref:Regulatory protein, luxR family n=1 Tax=Streptacidiphilus jiangxiensis TaxID=235985 RepID=A0A1H7ZE12_STRJI|nr:LuxR C-terminal-related transcriptional regulator [Streptacidiphilus jiangxiensis]SEM56576.1 regulatory protein, luxR family [Streptacidiphilus jiangxiensis]